MMEAERTHGSAWSPLLLSLSFSRYPWTCGEEIHVPSEVGVPWAGKDGQWRGLAPVSS